MALRIDPNNMPARRSTTPRVDANDFKQFAALRRGAEANDPATLRAAAKQFESLFTKMMLESMRSASMGDPMFGSDQGDMYQDMADDQLAVQLSQGRGLGLADMLIRQLSGGASGSAAIAPAFRHGRAPRRPNNAKNSSPGSCRMPKPRRASSASIPTISSRRRRSKPAGAVRSPAATVTTCSASRPAEVGTAQAFRQTRKSLPAGVASRVDANFRAYGSPRESVEDYVRLIRDNPRYAGAMNTGSDVQAFANALQRGGYATDPDYASKLSAVAAEVRQRIAANSFKSASAEPIPAQGPLRKSIMADVLSTGLSSLRALQRALDTTSHNIANVSTEGYTRQRVEFQSRRPELSGGGWIGTGVETSTVRRVYDQFLAQQTRSSGDQSRAARRVCVLRPRASTTC